MDVPRVWKGANIKGPVAQAQQEPSHGCVRCCPSTGPGMGPLGAAKDSPRCTCIRPSAAPAAASPHNMLRCAFIPLAQPLERRWGRPNLNTLTPAAVSLASLLAFFSTGMRGGCVLWGPVPLVPFTQRASDPSQRLVDPQVLHPLSWLSSCEHACEMHTRGNCFRPPLPQTPCAGS